MKELVVSDVLEILSGFDQLSPGVFGWSEGYCFKGDEPSLDKELSFEIYSKLIQKQLALCNGCFSSVIIEIKKSNILNVKIISDRYSTKSLYYTFSNTNLIIGDNFWSVVGAIEKPRVSMKSVSEYFGFSYILSENTIVKGVKEINAATVLEFEYNIKHKKNTLLNQKAYWKYDSNPEIFCREDLIDGLYETYNSIAKRSRKLFQVLNVKKIGINLSAGKDSRLTSWMFDDELFSLRFYTNRSINRDLLTAIEISQQFEFPHTLNSLWHFFSAKPDEDIFWKLCPTSMFTISNNTMSLKLSGCFTDDAIISGHFGDFFSSGHLPLVGVLKNKTITIKEIANLSYKKNLVVPPDSIKTIFKKQNYDRLFSVEDTFKRLVYDATVRNKLSAITQVDLEQRQRRLFCKDLVALNTLGMSMTPFADMEYSDFFSKVPFEWTLHSRLVLSVMATKLKTNKYVNLFSIPVNGKKPKESKYPLAESIRETSCFLIKSKINRWLNYFLSNKITSKIITDRNFINLEILNPYYDYLDLIMDIDSLREYVQINKEKPSFILYQFWVIYSLGRIIKRIQ